MADPEFPYMKIGKKGRWQPRVVADTSDGEQRHWPPKGKYRSASDENYLIRLGEEWVRRDGLQEPGVQYHINKLPHGYAVFETDSVDGTQFYKRLFGHPSGKFYDSITTFTPHFFWLQDGMQGNCPCRLCSGKAPGPPVSRRGPAIQQMREPGLPRVRRPRDVLDPSVVIPNRLARDQSTHGSVSSTRESSTTGLATGRARRDVKLSGAPYARDEEGTEDVFKLFIKRLEASRNSARGMDDDIREINSLDWRAEHEHDGYGSDLLPTHITQIEQQHCFIPRVGELVLWCPHFMDQHYLMLDETTSEFKFYSFEDQCFHGHPEWRAGVVTAVPSATTQNGPVDFPDISDTPEKNTALNTAGFRVETLPDPNDPLNKATSKQYKFVPLRNIRPLAQWQVLLRGIAEKKLHPSIKNALTCMTSISLVEKFKAVGHWPAASFFCKGLFLGSELIVVGDTVRLVSTESPKRCTDVLHVDSIRLNLEDMRQEHIQPDFSNLSSKSSITLVGTAYTLDKSRSYVMPAQQIIDDDLKQIAVPTLVPPDIVKVLFRPVGSAEYGPWYRLHAEGKKYEVSYDQVLGRLYEGDAVRLWTGQRQHKLRNGDIPTQAASLDFDAGGIISARHYATGADERLPEPASDELLWFWADTRSEALDVATFNGIEVGKYHDIRDRQTLNAWHDAMKILNGHHITTAEISNFTSIFPGGTRGRKRGVKVVNGKVVHPGEPGYPADHNEEAVDAKPKASSQMAGAALASTDEDDGEGDDDDVETAGETKSRSNSTDMLAQFTRRPSPQPAKKALTKEEIMTQAAVMESIEGAQEFDYDVSEEEEWWEQPPPLARGGTEESEGGDYNPVKGSKGASFSAGRKSKYYYDSDEA